MAASELARFLLDVGGSAELTSRYIEDPDSVLKDYDLTEEEREASKSGDHERIRELLPQQGSEFNNIQVNIDG